MAVPTFTLVGGDKTPAGTPLADATGTLAFTLTDTLVDTTDNVRVHPVKITVTLSAGDFSQVLACCSGDLIQPSGVRYKVEERITGARQRNYYIAIPDTYAGQTVNLADLAPVPGTPQATWTIPDLTPEQGRDLIGTTLIAGQGITKTVDDAADTVTIAAEVTQLELDAEATARAAADTAEATARAAAITALSGTYLSLFTGGDPTGVLDSMPDLQAALDASHTVVLSGGTYLLDSMGFLDDSDTTRVYEIDLRNGATLVLGPNLPTVSTFTTEAGTKWAFMSNTDRAALVGGSITPSDANRSTGVGFPVAPRLHIRGGKITTNEAAAGVHYGNTATVKFENVIFRNVKYGTSWRGYSDGTTAIDCDIEFMASGGWLVLQTTNGDSLRIHNAKSYPFGAGIANLTDCFGATISDCTQGGLRFKSCRGINVNNHHVERAALRPFCHIDRSTVTFDGCFAMGNTNASGWFIEIDDDPADAVAGSDVILRNSVFTHYYAAGDVDVARLSDIRITNANTSTKVRNVGSKAYVWRGGTDEAAADSIVVSSAVAAITTGLTAARGLVASSAWELRRVGATWGVVAPGPLAGVQFEPALTAPSFLTNPAAAAVGGALVQGTTYEYAMACRDGAGNWTTPSVAQSFVATSSLCITFQVNVGVAPCTLVIFRKAAAGVLAAPDAYVEIPVDGHRTRIVDTGTRVQGRAWVTAAVPVPNTVGAANGTFDHIAFLDGTLLGKGAGSPEGVYAAPIGSMFSDTVSGLRYSKTSGTGNTGWSLLATSADVAAAVAALVNSAPGILDTLGEIATALQADESTAAALATTVAGKLAIASNLADLNNVGTALTNLGFSAFIKTLIDDVDAGTARTTLGLGNVDNTSDANKPVSTAQQTALDLKANLASPTFTGTVTVPDDSFAFAKVQNIATARLLGRTTAGSGDIEELSAAQARALAAVVPSGTSAWAGTTAYEKGQLVTYLGSLWMANSAFTSGSSFDPANWTLVEQGGYGFPTSIDIASMRGGDVLALTANDGLYLRSKEGGTISKIALTVGTQSGNISLSAYRNSGVGRAATPTGGQLATTGSIACPSGYNEVSLGSTITLLPGDWLAISASSGTATFRSELATPADTNLGLGIQFHQATAHPLPSTPSSLTACIGRTIVLIGVA